MSLANERVPESIVRSAIEWQMRLRGNPQLQEPFHDWLRRDPRHQLAWQRLQQMAGMFQASQLPDAGQTIPLLKRASADLSRRRTLKMLGLIVGGGALTAVSVPSAWHAGYATALGERRTLSLGNGTQVLLNGDSAVDVQGGELLLRSGEVLVDGPRWHARCRYAECSGTDARVSLRERDGFSEIRVDRGAVLVTSPLGQRRLQAGDGLGVSATAMTVLGKSAFDPFAWSRGLLVVNDIRLGEFLAEAGRYRHGWLGCDERVANLRLSGVFRLDEPASLLDNLTHLLPVKVVERTRWWVRLVPA
ncbi:DUF4880 domain-containing protein [Pseudomonas wadenswilerensis]